ncbi:DUF5381 family protein [Fictibacillus sp. NRS-1165]|uniref:DUF5381 family protein n=1 Tax=Fictibacillus sp. NRS-1165 TaxID=3144463 RepID=UPI003D2077EF
MKFVNETENGVQVTYSSFNLKWMVGGSLLLTAGSLYLMSSVMDVGIIRGFFNFLIGTAGLLFFGGILLRMLTIAWGNKVLFQIKPTGFVTRKGKEIPFSDIQGMSFGWHSSRPTGMVFKDVILHTDQKSILKSKAYLCTYNLLDDDEIEAIINKYVIPKVSESCKQAWLKKTSSDVHNDKNPNMPT